MRKKQSSGSRTRRKAKKAGEGPSLVFWIALLLGLIMLAYLGYKAATTQVTPPAATGIEQGAE